MGTLAVDDIIHHALAFDPKRTMHDDVTRSSVRALFEELAKGQVDFLLVGGVALLNYVEGRNTQDVDLIVAPEDVSRIGWEAKLRDNDFGEASYAGLHVDLLLTSNALFKEVIESERTVVSVFGRDVPCATREGLLLLKLFALPSLYRQAKFARAALYETDVLMLHQGVAIDDERILLRLSRHLPSHDLQELESILAEQRGRHRFRT